MHLWSSPMRRDDDGLSRLPCACHSVPQQPPGHGVHPCRRLVQEDDRRPTNESHACTQLPLVTSTAQVDKDILSTCTFLTKQGIFQASMWTMWRKINWRKGWDIFFSLHTCSCGPVCQHEAPAAATSGHSPRSRTHTSLVFLWALNTYSEFLFLSCGPTRRQTEGSNQCAAAPAIQR